MPTAQPKTTPRRRGAASTTAPGPTPRPFIFTYRCPAALIGRLNEARFALREASRTALVSKAITEYLDRRGITATQRSP